MLRRSLRRLADPTPQTPTGAVLSAGMPAGNPMTVSWYREGVIIRRTGSYRHNWPEGGLHVKAAMPTCDHALVHCVDNTNVKHVQLLHQANEKHSIFRFCPVVTRRVSILRFKSGRELMNRHQIEPGVVHWFALFTRRANHRRYSGLQISHDRMTGVLLNDKGAPVGTRVMYVAGRHITHKFHLKAAVMANYFV
jgi:ribosomal protein L14